MYNAHLLALLIFPLLYKYTLDEWKRRCKDEKRFCGNSTLIFSHDENKDGDEGRERQNMTERHFLENFLYDLTVILGA